MILFPNAKINVGLNILSRRADGYHEIETIMYPIGWRDVLEIVPAKGKESTLTVTGRKVDCPPEKNLVMKAYLALREQIEIPAVDIYLRKIIPDGAGLGGGSADAAFTLVGLNKLFSLNLSDDDLAKIAAGIGADCPFFVYNRPMMATGIGTDFRPTELNLKGYRLLVVKPTVSVPTAKAYAGVTPHAAVGNLSEIATLPIDKWAGTIVNDFEMSVFASYPEIEEVKKQICEMGAVYASMSGSGSAVYGLFECDNLAERARKRFPDYDISECDL